MNLLVVILGYSDLHLLVVSSVDGKALDETGACHDNIARDIRLLVCRQDAGKSVYHDLVCKANVSKARAA
jgi:hypothetical protein